MSIVGIDIGTTSVGGVLYDPSEGRVIRQESKDHRASLESPVAGAVLQDPDTIFRVAAEVVTKLTRVSGQQSGRPQAVGLTGQMHGILYIDKQGEACSPLFTWQDRRGAELVEGESHRSTWVDWIRELTGYCVPSGYGLMSHIINRREGLVPEEAVSVTTIMDYVGMRLVGRATPCIDMTNAHSLGFFDLQKGVFDWQALEKAGIDSVLLPDLTAVDTPVGRLPEGIPVYPAIGDNQAGFLGAVRSVHDTLLLNIGTSAQAALFSPHYYALSLDTGLEIRPFPGSGFLVVGASLSGGNVIALLHDFFRETCRTFCSEDPGELYDRMNEIMAGQIGAERQYSLPEVRPAFFGTRADPLLCGGVENLTPSNFNLTDLLDGFISGIANELYSLYRAVPAERREAIEHIAGVGNALKRNRLLHARIEDAFGLPCTLVPGTEEAAVGAARLAAESVGGRSEG
jgi:sedoheptulokinase